MAVSALMAWFGWPSPALADPHRGPAGCRAIPARDVGGRLEENAPAVGQPCDAQAITESRGPNPAASFDYLVATGAHGRRHAEAQRLSGIEIDRKVVLGWGLHWQVSRLLTFEDAIDVASRAPKLVAEIRPIRNQSAADNVTALLVDRGQLMLSCKRDD